MATFAEQLTAARKAAGMTQEELSEAVHVARNTISNWERGQRQPDLDTLRLLGQALHYDFMNDCAAQTEDAAVPAAADENGETPAELQPAKKRNIWVIAAAAVLILILIGTAVKLLWPQGTPAYAPAARLADEAGQLTVEFFQKPAQKAEKLPYLAVSYDTRVETDQGQDMFFYSFHLHETNGYRFKINQVVLYSFGPGNTYADPFPAEKLREFGLATEIPGHGDYDWTGGFPVQPYVGVGIITYGEDEQGTEMEFHGYIDYNASLPADMKN